MFIFGVIFSLSLTTLIKPRVIVVKDDDPRTLIQPQKELSSIIEPASGSPAQLVASMTAVASLIGTFSTMILAWRADRRATKEAMLKTQQIQQQIVELQMKLNSPSNEVNKSIEAGRQGN